MAVLSQVTQLHDVMTESHNNLHFLARHPDWRAPTVDIIDFSTMMLGFSSNFLPGNFYRQHAA